VRLLIDANLLVVVAEALRQHGHDVQHVREIGLQAADDETILQSAHLPIVEAALNASAIVVLSRGRIRIRSLPIEPPRR